MFVFKAKTTVLSLAFFCLVSFEGVALSQERTLETQVDAAWNAAWDHFYSPQTRLFYDFLESLEPGKTLDHLPTSDEVDSLYPHACGYGTGMEDCAISGGVILDALIDRYANEEKSGANPETLQTIKVQAQDVFSGLELLTTVSGSPGFVARGVSPKAIDKCYINSSRDQVTHLDLAVWNYWRSPLSDPATRDRAASILYAIADRMSRNVTPENDYDFLCSDGSHCRIGISRMADVEDHEAARLTAIYAVAWDVAKRSNDSEKENEYWGRWRKIAYDTIAQSAHIIDNPSLCNRMPSYAYLQMQESLNVLYQLEPDQYLKESIGKTLSFVADRVKSRQKGALEKLKNHDLTQIAPSWREVGGLKGPYREIWYCPRECGEIALTIAADSANDSFDLESANVLKDALMTPDYAKISSCGVFHLLGAYEKARRLGWF
ncbi:MAG: hypothetical protein J6X44_06935 [Thermoguttaceae bacterium]|nr:hypothetical protein [Thermoguttaceae bacterium]